MSGENPIVGVGASAGGIEALEGFFRGLPEVPDLTIVIVTHLSPDRDSLLHEVVARFTPMPVVQIEDGLKADPNTIYVMTNPAILSIRNRIFSLQRVNGRPQKPVDIFFCSLAVDLGELAVGVVLSGGDGDGALGVKAIKERGGLTLAQVADGFGPGHPDMPESAISTGFVDFAIPVETMGARLLAFAHSEPAIEKLVADGPPSSEESEIHALLPEIYNILRNQIGHDFSGYKIKTFLRRVLRRMQVNQLTTLDGYAEHLRQHPQEVNALFRDLLINVTNFFRDSDAFETLAASVIPKLFENKGAEDTVRVWVPGCSTGEEVFSIAILLREYMDTLSAVPRVQVFATDIDESALGIARTARYPEVLLDTVSAARRKRYFVADGGSFVVSKDIRELCIFSPHSVIRDPPFSRIDLISCRNLLIYFGPEAQNQVIPTFHYALRSDGYLFLGTAENVSHFEDLFVPLEKKHRIFRRRSEVASSVRLPILLNAFKPGGITPLVSRRPSVSGLTLRQMVDEHVLERFGPPHVVVNRDGDVVYYSTKTGRYLEMPAGAPTRQLLTLARKELRLDLRSLFREAVETGQSATREDVAVESDEDSVLLVKLVVEKLTSHDGDPLYIVLFFDRGPPLGLDDAVLRTRRSHSETVLHAERELRETHARLQSMIEEYETALEELKSSNEELVSVNEEMQSTNEELEASKEEFQSVNEELHTVNAELSTKVEALDQSNNDLQNLFDSTEVAIVFLDSSLAIRSYTPTVARIFHVLPSDRGRPITDLSGRLNLKELAKDIKHVISGNGPIERRITSDDYTTHYLIRLSPYQSSEQHVDGIVIAFIDVTNLTRAEERQRLLIAELQHRTRNLLTVVQSIAQQTLKKGASPQEFSARLAALGRVQSLISSGHDDAVDLSDLLRLELETAGGVIGGNVHLSGPTVSLNFELVQTIGLAVHELTTNALKYGALKQPEGRLAASWSVVSSEAGIPCLHLDWQELGVSIKEPPLTKGFGRELIERALVFSLQAKSEMTFGEQGLRCTITLPLPAIREPPAA